MGEAKGFPLTIISLARKVGQCFQTCNIWSGCQLNGKDSFKKKIFSKVVFDSKKKSKLTFFRIFFVFYHHRRDSK